MKNKTHSPISLLPAGWRCLHNATVNTINHDGIEHAGYLAFLGLLALFPFLVFMFAVIGVLGQGEAGEAFITSLLQELPHSITAALQPRIIEIISGPPHGLLTVSIIGAIWTASSAVEGLRTILNRAYHVATPPAYWFRRSLSIVQLLFFTFILIAGMIVIVTAPLIVHHFAGWFGINFSTQAHEGVSFSVFLLTIALLFFAVCSIYYLIPNIKQSMVAVAPGAFIVVALWIGAAYAFTQYLSHFEQVNLIYGSLGGIIAALIFFYICNIIFIFGAELNYQIVHALGLRVVQREEVIEADADSDLME